MGYSPWGCKRVGRDLVTKKQLVGMIFTLRMAAIIFLFIASEQQPLLGQTSPFRTLLYVMFWAIVSLRSCVLEDLKWKNPREPFGTVLSFPHFMLSS